jgi:serine protease DegQ
MPYIPTSASGDRRSSARAETVGVSSARRFCVLVLGLALLLGACTDAAVEPTAPALPVTPAPEQPIDPGTERAPERATPAPEAAAPPAEEAQATPEPEAGAGDPFAMVADLVADVEPQVVAVLTDAGQGSGVIYSSDGAIVTNHHVIAEGEQVGVALATGERLLAEVVGSDPQTDVAVLRVEADGLPAAEWDTELPRLGSLAVAIGSPLGFHNSVTVGVVSGVQRAIPGSGPQAQALIDLIQTDAAISPGNSGGALVGADGRVIGIAVAHIPPELRAVSIGFAIPSATVVDVVETLLAGEPVQHAFLGVQTAPLTPQLAERFDLQVTLGAVVLDTVPNGPAADAGVQTGDVIIGLAGEPVNRVEDMLSVLRRLNPGDLVEVTIERNGEELTLEVELAERP